MKDNVSQSQQSVKVKLTGMIAIMFDRFLTMSSNDIPPEQKLYLNSKNELIFPSENIYSFLFGEKPGGCAKRFEGKQWKQYKMDGMAFVSIKPEFIPFTKDGKPVRFTEFVNGVDQKAGIIVLHHKAVVQKGSLYIPSPKVRPVLEAPWELEYEVTVYKNTLVDIDKIKNWHVKGGFQIGLGTYRPRFGRFTAQFSE